MSRLQKQQIAFLLLVAVMAAVYARALSRPRQPIPAAGSADKAAAMSAADALSSGASGSDRQEPPLPSAQELSVRRQTQRRSAALLAWSRDPFFGGMALGQLNGLVLTGILWDAVRPLAVINGEMVQVGDRIEGYRVAAISPDQVSLTDGDQSFQLRLSP